MLDLFRDFLLLSYIGSERQLEAQGFDGRYVRPAKPGPRAVGCHSVGAHRVGQYGQG